MMAKVLLVGLMVLGACFVLGVSRYVITAMLFLIVVAFITAALRRTK